MPLPQLRWPMARAGVARRVPMLTLAAGSLLAPNVIRTEAQGTPRATVISLAERAAVVDSLAGLLERMYVSPDTGRLIAQHLRARLEGGTYDGSATTGDFAAQLTRDLRAINADGHLAVDRQSTFATPQGAPEAARRANYNFERVEHLDGNVGYLRMSAFSGAPGAREMATSALSFLAGSDAVILDLRNSRGGSGDMANFIISHFAGKDSVRSLGIYNRLTGDTVYRWTIASVPGPRLEREPLFVLVDGVTRSAAEDVAFVLRNLGRARIVGERTAGAGHNVALLRVGPDLLATVSITRVFDPTTHSEWERSGVPLDVPVPAAGALDVAHAEALQAIAAKERDPRRRVELALLRESVLAKAAPVAVPPAALQAYVGDYGGGGLVTLSDGRLFQQARKDQPRAALVPMSASRFAAGAARLEFVREGGALRLRVTHPGEAPVTYARRAPDGPA